MTGSDVILEVTQYYTILYNMQQYYAILIECSRMFYDALYYAILHNIAQYYAFIDGSDQN